MARKESGKAGTARHPGVWAWGKGMLVRPGGKHAAAFVWEPYELTGEDNLTLRATLRIWGGSAAFLSFDTPEARRAYIDEDSRQVTWRNAMAMAEVLWRTDPVSKEFVVLYCPVGQFGEMEELIRIYQRFQP